MKEVEVVRGCSREKINERVGKPLSEEAVNECGCRMLETNVERAVKREL